MRSADAGTSNGDGDFFSTPPRGTAAAQQWFGASGVEQLESPKSTFADSRAFADPVPIDEALLTPVKGPSSIKNQEQLIAELKKDNFNLKLRIYHMEEQLSQVGRAATPSLDPPRTPSLSACDCAGSF